jgi:hypothetical protein
MDSKINGANPVFYGEKHGIYSIIHPLSTLILKSKRADHGLISSTYLRGGWVGLPISQVRPIENLGVLAKKYRLFHLKISHITLLTSPPFSHKFIGTLIRYFPAIFFDMNYPEDGKGATIRPQKGLIRGSMDQMEEC